MKQFILSFQSLIRKEFPLVLLMTGLYENISALENERNMTFLIRSPKIFLSPLNLQAITRSYQSKLGLTQEEAIKCAKLTKGYAFAFQLLGYLMFEENKKEVDKDLQSLYDSYLAEYAYAKIWSTLSDVEKNSHFLSNELNHICIYHLRKNRNEKGIFLPLSRSPH